MKHTHIIEQLSIINPNHHQQIYGNSKNPIQWKLTMLPMFMFPYQMYCLNAFEACKNIPRENTHTRIEGTTASTAKCFLYAFGIARESNA